MPKVFLPSHRRGAETSAPGWGIGLIRKDRVWVVEDNGGFTD